MSIELIKQHLIDPEICIRCYTCEETCQLNAISHDDNNVVVDASICNFCMDCISPCPTGSIDNWRFVQPDQAFSVEEQLQWEELPEEDEPNTAQAAADNEALDAEIQELIQTAHAGAKGVSHAPESAEQPTINLYNRRKPAIAEVQGNIRITSESSDYDVRQIILSLGDQHFPILEGQSVGIVPPSNTDKPETLRLYSVSSPRDGEKRNANNFSLTVKRAPMGKCSNYLCDLKKGDKVEISGPYGSTFLMPNDPSAHILMICTGTGSAPFRAFTERRRRAAPGASGSLMLFFGARSPDELPYFGPLQKVPDWLLKQHLVYSRVPDRPKEYVQDRVRLMSDELGQLLKSPKLHIYVCGLKGMESGVEEALQEVAENHQLDWDDVRKTMQTEGRFHVETY